LALHLSDRLKYQAYVVAYSQDVLPDLGEQVSGLLVFFVCVQPFEEYFPVFVGEDVPAHLPPVPCNG